MSENKNSMIVKEVWSCDFKSYPMDLDSAEFFEALDDDANAVFKREDFSLNKVATSGFYWLCGLSEEDSDKHYARLISITDVDGNIVDHHDFVRRYTPSNHRIRFSAYDGRILSGTIEELADASHAVFSHSEEEMRKKTLELVAEKVKEGIREKKDADEAVEYMVSQKVHWGVIYDTVCSWKKHDQPAVKPVPCYIDPYLEESEKEGCPGVLERLLINMLSGMGTILSGDKSLGKSTLAKSAIWCRNQTLYSVVFGPEMSRSLIYGEHTTDNSAAEEIEEMDPETLVNAKRANEYRKTILNAMTDGKIPSKASFSSVEALIPEDLKAAELMSAEFEIKARAAASVRVVVQKSSVYKAIEDESGLLIDEWNLAQPAMATEFLNPLLDNGRVFNAPGLPLLHASNDFSLILTQNVDYSGTQDQNEATLSRLKRINLKYPKSVRSVLKTAAEAQLRMQGFDAEVKKELLDQAEKFYDQCHTSFTRALISDASMNVRGFAGALAISTRYPHVSLRQNLIDGVISLCPPDEEKDLTSYLNDIVTL